MSLTLILIGVNSLTSFSLAWCCGSVRFMSSSRVATSASLIVELFSIQPYSVLSFFAWSPILFSHSPINTIQSDRGARHSISECQFASHTIYLSTANVHIGELVECVPVYTLLNFASILISTNKFKLWTLGHNYRLISFCYSTFAYRLENRNLLICKFNANHLPCLFNHFIRLVSKTKY